MTVTPLLFRGSIRRQPYLCIGTWGHKTGTILFCAKKNLAASGNIREIVCFLLLHFVVPVSRTATIEVPIEVIPRHEALRDKRTGTRRSAQMQLFGMLLWVRTSNPMKGLGSVGQVHAFVL